MVLHRLCADKLRIAARSNKFGFKNSDRFLFDIPAVQNELKWLLSHFFIAGVDKASNNVSFMCIRHLQFQAYQRLMGDDFEPCKHGTNWLLPTAILDSVKEKLTLLILEIPHSFNALPFLMANYKQHKQKYRWLTNAFQTIFSHSASLLTIATMEVLEKFKVWCKKTKDGYSNFLQVNTSLYWIVDSALQVTLNLPPELSDIFVADVTQCYESIPLQGEDNLLNALKFVLAKGFKEAEAQHFKSNNRLWIRVAANGTPGAAKWCTSQPKGSWFEMPLHRLLALHEWLMTNCHVVLGDRVWLQTKGIPMGFSCSPLWCNIYLLSYEVRFIQRLQALGRVDIMKQFRYVFRYIDDICWLNVGNPMDFLSPTQPRTDTNPFWIYPLNILKIKSEVFAYDIRNPVRGIAANFMNVSLEIVGSSVYSIRKHDKRRTLPFPYTQFLKFRSNRPVKQSYNVIISQILPILYISNSVQFAALEIELLIATMMSNGFQEQRLRRLILEWLKSNYFPHTKFSIPDTILVLSRYEVFYPHLCFHT